MTASPDRRAELIAAAVGDDLDDAEADELRALAASDPTVDIEIAELRATTEQLERRGPDLLWLDSTPPPGLRERILAATQNADNAVAPGRSGSSGLQPVAGPRFGVRNGSAGLAAAAALVGVVVGSAAVLGIDAYRSEPGEAQVVVTGPPGTLGAYEEIAFTTSGPTVDVEGGLVAHTWGTETVLEMDGISDGGPYDVVLVDRSGVDRPSGTFLGSTVTIECRMNAAVLRGDVAEIEIRGSDGVVLASAQVPSA
ncbi:anti-sigma factor [Rhodococcus fascians]|uniref:anti-sigma factor n=1 Tax=Rhodococcus sp. NPDC077669 TaxID=3155174 RepID=UPI001C916B20|nr:anti-sigma factor [Rhodococcus fascians]MBY3826980.1 anti-sigma factor [Rhodococcus fascians]MBY3837440.1 anti-sigma factor [Rhodococcus fascians]MBY3866712.1 anti-sigma factor [Rhodococcus fascians]MBY3886018.1 anti-sigma factor [Rhodococcus fascians]